MLVAMMMITMANVKELSRKGIRVILDAANMSKQVTIKNQNKLKVYLEKAKKNDIKPNSQRTDKDRKRPRTD